MPKHIKWPSIDQFHNVRKNIVHRHDGDFPITFMAKVKLHGTNAAVQVFPELGKVWPQSRNNILSFSNDNAGFASWVNSVKDEILSTVQKRCIIYGEWIGTGIQQKVACCQIGTKAFCVFAVQELDENGDLTGDLITDPAAIESFTSIQNVSNCKVIPWYSNNGTWLTTISNWSADNENLKETLDKINQWVNEIDKNDPWIESEFGIKGPGEGLVFYPIVVVDQLHNSNRDNFSSYAFKAKGEAHRTVEKQLPAQVRPETVESAKAYAQMVCTPARLEQGVREISGGELVFDIKNTGNFLKWIHTDLSKETVDELAVSKVEAKFALKTAVEYARRWYLSNIPK